MSRDLRVGRDWEGRFWEVRFWEVRFWWESGFLKGEMGVRKSERREEGDEERGYWSRVERFWGGLMADE